MKPGSEKLPPFVARVESRRPLPARPAFAPPAADAVAVAPGGRVGGAVKVSAASSEARGRGYRSTAANLTVCEGPRGVQRIVLPRRLSGHRPRLRRLGPPCRRSGRSSRLRATHRRTLTHWFRGLPGPRPEIVRRDGASAPPSRRRSSTALPELKPADHHRDGRTFANRLWPRRSGNRRRSSAANGHARFRPPSRADLGADSWRWCARSPPRNGGDAALAVGRNNDRRRPRGLPPSACSASAGLGRRNGPPVAKAFGMEVLAWSQKPRPRGRRRCRRGARPVEKGALLEAVPDIVSVPLQGLE